MEIACDQVTMKRASTRNFNRVSSRAKTLRICPSNEQPHALHLSSHPQRDIISCQKLLVKNIKLILIICLEEAEI